MKKSLYEVVYTEGYLDVGLLVKSKNGISKKVLARSSQYSKEPYYGGAEYVYWMHTGLYMTIQNWKEFSLGKTTEQILKEVKIISVKDSNEMMVTVNDGLITKKDIINSLKIIKQVCAEYCETDQELDGGMCKLCPFEKDKSCVIMSIRPERWKILDEGKEFQALD